MNISSVINQQLQNLNITILTRGIISWIPRPLIKGINISPSINQQLQHFHIIILHRSIMNRIPLQLVARIKTSSFAYQNINYLDSSFFSSPHNWSLFLKLIKLIDILILNLFIGFFYYIEICH